MLQYSEILYQSKIHSEIYQVGTIELSDVIILFNQTFVSSVQRSSLVTVLYAYFFKYRCKSQPHIDLF